MGNMSPNLLPGNLNIYGNLGANGISTVLEPSIDISNLVGTQFTDDSIAVLDPNQLQFGYNSVQITGPDPINPTFFSFADLNVSAVNGVFGIVVQQSVYNGVPLVNNLIDYTYLDSMGNPIPNTTFTAQLVGWNDTGAIFQRLNPFFLPLNGPQNGSAFGTNAPALQVGPNAPTFIYFSFNNLDVSTTLNQTNNTTAPGFPIVFTDQGTSQFLNGNSPPPNPNITFQPPMQCFAPGTLIRTARGDVPVEALKPCDLVITIDGQLLPVRRIGAWDVDPENPHHAAAGPVAIAANAFGPGLPEQPLSLSPDHAVFLDGDLVPVRGLINGHSIRQLPLAAASRYHHVLLDCHAVLFANGLPAESYLETGDVSGDWPFPAASASMTAVVLAWEVRACAPLLVAGPALRALRERIARRPDAAASRAIAA